MKNKFDFLGIKSPERRDISRAFLNKSSLPHKDQLWDIVKELWNLPEREFQYFAMELVDRFNKQVEKDWINHYEYMIIHRSWWDTVDFIAATLAGNYFRIFPEEINLITGKWMGSGNMWLQRSCLLFQLKYKNDTDPGLMERFIIPLSSSREFFISKAIGWCLREYSKSNPEWVRNFINNYTLQPLSVREGGRLLT